MRYGFTTHALIASTIAKAETIVTTQSSATRIPCERFGNRRSIGPRMRLRDCGYELAADQGDRVEILVREVLEHHALVAALPDLLQALDHLLDRPAGAVLPVAGEDLLRLASEPRARAPPRLEQLPLR